MLALLLLALLAAGARAQVAMPIGTTKIPVAKPINAPGVPLKMAQPRECAGTSHPFAPKKNVARLSAAARWPAGARKRGIPDTARDANASEFSVVSPSSAGPPAAAAALKLPPPLSAPTPTTKQPTESVCPTPIGVSDFMGAIPSSAIDWSTYGWTQWHEHGNISAVTALFNASSGCLDGLKATYGDKANPTSASPRW